MLEPQIDEAFAGPGNSVERTTFVVCGEHAWPKYSRPDRGDPPDILRTFRTLFPAMTTCSSLRKLFLYYKDLGEKAIGQVKDDDLHRVIGDDGNSLAVIVQHVAGNARSRFTDFLSSDGEKPWRDREAEFTERPTTRAELLADWESGWACLFSALDHLNDTDLERLVYIRNEGHTVQEALHRQLAHYAYHVGQLVLLARSFVGREWRSLSIPRGASAAFNALKFTRPADRKHFTDDKA